MDGATTQIILYGVVAVVQCVTVYRLFRKDNKTDAKEVTKFQTRIEQ
ncbi:unnamed protein product [marine sediment metagenome]|uniref:Uncharacterized protein n=1 Tax=marine sediment metagenome TaxID=412755 RepID=X1FNK6_9ZZZZ